VLREALPVEAVEGAGLEAVLDDVLAAGDAAAGDAAAGALAAPVDGVLEVAAGDADSLDVPPSDEAPGFEDAYRSLYQPPPLS
jgi:hypothetical protein